MTENWVARLIGFFSLHFTSFLSKLIYSCWLPLPAKFTYQIYESWVWRHDFLDRGLWAEVTCASSGPQCSCLLLESLNCLWEEPSQSQDQDPKEIPAKPSGATVNLHTHEGEIDTGGLSHWMVQLFIMQWYWSRSLISSGGQPQEHMETTSSIQGWLWSKREIK